MGTEQRGARRASHPVVPDADRPYGAEALWGGQRYAFEVVFSDAFVRVLRQAGAAVDLVTGEVVYAGGEARDLFGVRDDFQRRTGARAPAWLFRWPSDRQGFVLARGRLRIDAEPDGTVTIHPPKACSPVFVCLGATYLGRPVSYGARSFRPVETREWAPETRRLLPGLELVGSGRTLLERAARAFEAVCGRAARPWSARRILVEERLRDTYRLSSALLETLAGGEPASAALLEQTRAALPPQASSRPADLIEALASARRDLEAEIMPVRLVVVPRGVHFSALPEMEPLRAQVSRPPVAFDEHGVTVSSASPLQSATVVLRGRRYVFLPAEDLEDLQISSRHELYHLLESQLLTQAGRRRIDGFHRDTVANGGPFARPYGFLRQEFLPTMAEVYEGAYGDEGVAWLRRYHGELWDFLDEVTGGREATCGIDVASRPRRARH